MERIHSPAPQSSLGAPLADRARMSAIPSNDNGDINALRAGTRPAPVEPYEATNAEIVIGIASAIALFLFLNFLPRLV